jgi:hypothetical protein
MSEQRYSDVAELARLADALAKVSATQIRAFETDSLRLVKNTRKAEGRVPRHAPRAKRKSAFPRFERDADTLVKVGWSKKNRASYQHRAPKETVLAFLRHLTASVQGDSVFAVEDLMPVPDFEHGGEVPAYRVYLAMAWLRHLGIVKKTGRNGYVLNRQVADLETLLKSWAELPPHKASA